MTAIEIVKKSQGRCLLREDFIDVFYDIFLKSSPEIAPKFAQTDFVEQKKLLKHGINCILMYYAKNKAGQFCLDRIGKSHDHNHLNIRPELYHFWVESLLETIKKVDPKVDAEILSAWKEVAGSGVDYIKSQY